MSDLDQQLSENIIEDVIEDNLTDIIEHNQKDFQDEDQQAGNEAQIETEDREESSTESSEERARLLGWTPKEKFKGDPGRWVDADKFLKKADSDFGLMRSNNERLFKEDEALKRQAEEAKRTAQEFGEWSKNAIKREHERAKKELLAAQKEAVSIGDTESWERIENEKQKLVEDYQAQIAEKQKPPEETIDPVFDVFVKENQWYQTDKELQDLADYTANQFRQQGDTSVGIAFMRKVADRVKSIRADKFTNQNKARAPRMEEGNSTSAQKPSVKTYANLPPEAKKACDDMLKHGFFSSRDDYVKHYQWDK